MSLLNGALIEEGEARSGKKRPHSGPRSAAFVKEAALGKRERRERAITCLAGKRKAYKAPGAGGGIKGRNWLLASQTQFWGLWGASEWSRLVGGSPKKAEIGRASCRERV